MLSLFATWSCSFPIIVRHQKARPLQHTSSVLESPLLWWCHCCRCADVFAVIAMALLPSSQWRRCRCWCTGILPLSTMMATARRATSSLTIVTVQRTSTLMATGQRMMTSTIMILTDNDADDNDGDDAMGNNNDVDSNNATDDESLFLGEFFCTKFVGT